MKKNLPSLRSLIFAACLFVFYNTGKAQNYVTIPDTNFVKYLQDKFPNCMNGNKMDTTCSGIVNATYVGFTEENAGPVWKYDVYDIYGIQYFDNLDSLDCSSHKLTYLPALPKNLKFLDCTGTKLTNLPTLPTSLIELYCGSNNFTSFPNVPPFLKILNCYRTNLTSLPDLPSTLTYLDCSINEITNIDTLPPFLEHFDCSWTHFTSLPTLPSTLTLLTCDYTYLDSLPVLPPSLQSLECTDNGFTSLPQLPLELIFLSCKENALTSLPPLPAHLRTLDCASNRLTVLPVYDTSLTYLSCRGNQLTSISTLPSAVWYVDCGYNQLSVLPSLPPALEYLICDNNQLTNLPPLPSTITTLLVNNNPNLKCLPPIKKLYSFSIQGTQIKCLPNAIQEIVSIPDIENTPICDLINLNNCDIAWNIEGSIYEDDNYNCKQDVADGKLAFVKVNLFQGTNLLQSGYFGGDYSFRTGIGTYRIAIDTSALPFTFCKVDTTVNLTTVDTLAYRVNFGLKCKPGFDVGVSSIVGGRFRPATITQLNIAAGNLPNIYNAHCNLNVAGTVTVSITGPAKYISPATGALTPSSASSNTVMWNVANFSITDFYSSFNIMLQTDTTATIGSQVCITVNVTPTVGDNNTANNTLTQCFTVRGSYDPNEKEVYPAGNIDLNTQWLTYTIHFQNTGTDTAQNISITDTLSNNLDLSSFQLLTSSHKNITQILEGGIVKFSFPNINLPDSNVNEALSHGYVQYRIKRKANLIAGAEIKNTAYIFFDFNIPVITNTVSSIMGTVTGIENVPGYQLTLYPNPSNDVLHISVIGFTPKHINLYDLSGRRIMDGSFTSTLQTASLTAGIYFIEVLGQESAVRRKFVKE